MRITYKWWNDGSNTTETSTTEAERLKTYKGHDIYKDSEGWLFICINEEWSYFGTIREAQKFIRDLYTE